MSRYESYKESGIDWIGDIPSHWFVKRLKQIVLNDIGGLWGDEPADDENDIIVLRVADFDRTNSRIIDNPNFTYRNIKPSQLEGRLLKQGDILLEKSGGGEQQPVGKAVLFDKDFRAVTSNFINKIETISSINNHYSLYLFDALYYNSINVRNIKQTTGIQNLDNVGFFSEKIPLPPYPEQLAIANYLDNQTQKIDRLIANKKTQAEKLKELRQIEINNAVTKGLNPHAEMKDSGIEWLGIIPKHWEVKRLKNIGDAVIGLTYAPEDVLEGETGTLVLRSSNIQNGKISFDDCVYVEKKIPENLKVRKGDILICSRNGSAELIGKNILIDESLEGHSFGAFMTVYRSNQWQHLFWFFNSPIFKAQSGLFSTTTINQLTTHILNNMKVAIPPTQKEIKEIANYLQQLTTTIDQLIRNIEAQIEKLQELRKIKIYEAVTGKIKVNGYES